MWKPALTPAEPVPDDIQEITDRYRGSPGALLSLFLACSLEKKNDFSDRADTCTEEYAEKIEAATAGFSEIDPEMWT